MELTLPSALLAAGYLPPVCPRHGVLATHRVHRRFVSQTSLWVLLIVVASALLALIVALLLRKTVAATLPACARCRRDRRRAVLSVFGAWGLALLVGAGAIAARNAPAGWLCVLLVVVALVWWMASPVLYQVPGCVVHDGGYVRLPRLHPAFVRALADPAAPRSAGVPAQRTPGYQPRNGVQVLPPPAPWPPSSRPPWPGAHQSP